MKNKTPYEKYDFLRSFTRTSLAKDDTNACIWCPFCKHPNKNKLKMVIHLEKNLYHCWICGKKGSNVNYLVSRIDKSKQKESERFFRKPTKNNFDLGININSLFSQFEEIEDFEENKVETPRGYKLLATAYNSINPDVRDVFKYAIKRGANKHKFWMLRLGYSLDDEFKRCLILPSLDDNGEINFYTCRKIDVGSGDSFKYKNANIKKSKIIFNDINIDWNERLTIVEGPLDLLKTNDNSTCLLGSSLTPDMLLFKKIVENKTPIALALDSDVYHKTLKIAKLLSEYDIDIRIVDTRGADDVGDMSINQFQEVLDEASQYQVEDSLLAKIAML